MKTIVYIVLFLLLASCTGEVFYNDLSKKETEDKVENKKITDSTKLSVKDTINYDKGL